MPRWTVEAGASQLAVELVDDGRLCIDVTNGPFVVDRQEAEQVRAAIGAGLLSMDGTPS